MSLVRETLKGRAQWRRHGEDDGYNKNNNEDGTLWRDVRSLRRKQKSIGSILYAAVSLRRLEAATETFAEVTSVFQATAGHVRESCENIH